MKNHNLAVLHQATLPERSPAGTKIANTAEGKTSFVYPASTTGAKCFFKKYTMNQRVNLNVDSGGGNVARYAAPGLQ